MSTRTRTRKVPETQSNQQVQTNVQVQAQKTRSRTRTRNTQQIQKGNQNAQTVQEAQVPTSQQQVQRTNTHQRTRTRQNNTQQTAPIQGNGSQASHSTKGQSQNVGNNNTGHIDERNYNASNIYTSQEEKVININNREQTANKNNQHHKDTTQHNTANHAKATTQPSSGNHRSNTQQVHKSSSVHSDNVQHNTEHHKSKTNSQQNHKTSSSKVHNTGDSNKNNNHGNPNRKNGGTANKNKTQQTTNKLAGKQTEILHDTEIMNPHNKPEKKHYYSQDLIPVKDIRGGIVETTDGRYVKIIEIEPINFSLRSSEEQYEVLCSFAGWLKIAPINIQFKSITRSANANKHIKLIQEAMKTETNENCLAMADDYINLVRDVSSREALTRRFFLIIQYERIDNMQSMDFDDAYVELREQEHSVKANFFECGNEIVKKDNEDYAAAEILYTFFNRLSCIDETLNDRIQRVIDDTCKLPKNKNKTREEVTGKIPIVSYIAPRGVDMSHRDYFVMDGLYYTIMCIKSNGYPDSVRGGWISMLVDAGEGIDVDIFVHKEDMSRILDALGRKIRNNRAKMTDMQDTSKEFENLYNTIDSGYFIKNQIANNNEEFFYMTIMITMSAPTFDELMIRRRRFNNLMKSHDIRIGTCNYQQEEALQSVMPLIKPNKNLFEKNKRNILTSALASTYMYTSFEMCDDTGVLMGVNRMNNSLCILDLFDAKVNKNANVTMVGTSGAGKTFTMQLLALRMRMRDIQCFIIAPTKGHEFARACENIGGSFIRIAPGSPHCINILEIRYTLSPDMELIDGSDYNNETSMLSKKIQQIMTMFSLLIDSMTEEEEQYLDDALMKTYADFGITNDNDSLYLDKNANPPVLKEMPLLSDLQKTLKDMYGNTRLSTVLNRFTHGSAQNFNQQTNVDLNNKYIVLDLSGLENDKRLLSVGMMIAVDYVWDIIKQDRTKKKAIMLDEIWTLIGATANRTAAQFCLEIFKLIRGYGGGAIAATQDLSDFFSLDDGKYGRAIVNNSKTKIVLNLEHDEAETVKEVMKLTKNEIRQITRFERGEGLIISNSTKVPIYVRASQVEHDMITTDRAELEEQLIKKKNTLGAGSKIAV